MKRTLILLYGTAAYAIGMASLVYMMGWLGNLLVPRTIDSPPEVPFWWACLVNISLFLLFSVRRGLMARPRFKAWWTRRIPQSTERSTYVLFSSVALFALMLGWQPLGGQIWLVEQPMVKALLYTLYIAGWVMLVGSTFALNHWDLFGLRQVWLQFTGRDYKHLPFATPGPYRWVRHPLYVGWLTLAWSTPSMTAAHFAFAVFTTVYILIAIRWEEKDLLDVHGATYEQYRRQTPMLVPNISSPKSPQAKQSPTSSLSLPGES